MPQEEDRITLSREDVLKLIEQKGGTTRGLDLSGREFEVGIDLGKLNLGGITLKNANLASAILQRAKLDCADLDGANLEGADLRRAQLNDASLRSARLGGAKLSTASLSRAKLQDADLRGAELPGASLEYAELQGVQLGRADLASASLIGARLQGAYLSDARWQQARLKHVDWGSHVLGEEEAGTFAAAEDTYRELKQWYTNAGVYGTAGEFFFREMIAQRRGMRWWPRPHHRVWSCIMSFLCGYGERPMRVIGWAVSVILGLAVVYFLVGSVWQWQAFWDSLYLSAVSFTALGYGNWVAVSDHWLRGLGAAESFLGVFSMALFLVTFTRRMRR